MTERDGNREAERSIHTDFSNEMKYDDYLQLGPLLSSQKRLSDHHDEMLFIIIHQVNELWMKLILHELRATIQALDKLDVQPAFKMLARVSRIQTQMIHGWDVLSTLTPSEYVEFRDHLRWASGFQSYQHRMIEFALGYKRSHIIKIYERDARLHAELKEAILAPSIYDVSIQLLAHAGLSINKDVFRRDFSMTYKGDSSVANAWREVYLDKGKYWDLYELAEKLVDLEDSFSQWRFRHMKTVERMIGFKKGTGGSSGVNYLRQVLDHRFFPELWDVRTEL